MRKPFFIAALCFLLLLFGCVSSPANAGPQVQNGTITEDGKIASGGLIISTNATALQGAQVVPILPEATSGQEYGALISVTGGSGPYHCSPAPGTSLPGELVFQEPGCTISGTAPTLSPGTQSAIYPLSFVVTDSAGNAAGPITFNLIVNQPQMIFAVAGLPNGAVGQRYSYSFCQPAVSGNDLCDNASNPSGGQPPYHFTLDSGAGFQPMGLTLHPNGLLNGVPSKPGDYSFSVCAVDEAGNQKCASLTLTVISNPPNFIHYDEESGTWVEHLLPRLHPAIASSEDDPPPYRLVLDGDLFTSNGEGTAAEDGEQSYFISGGHGPYSFNATGLPAGLSISGGILGGTLPSGTNAGDYPATICVTDSSNVSTCENTTIPVVELNVKVSSIRCTFTPAGQYGGYYTHASASGSADTSEKGIRLVFEGWTSGTSYSFGDDTYVSNKTCPGGWTPYCLLGCSAEPVPLDALPKDQYGNIWYDNGGGPMGSYTDTCEQGGPLSGTWSYDFGEVYGVAGETVNINVSEYIGNRSHSRNTVYQVKSARCG